MVWLRARLFPELHTEMQISIQSVLKSLIKQTHIGSYKSTHTIAQYKYIHTQIYTRSSCFHAQRHNHPSIFTNTLINNQTQQLRHHHDKTHKCILIDKYKKLQLKTPIQRPYKHTTPPHTHTHRVVWMNHKQDANTPHSLTYHRVSTHSQEAETRMGCRASQACTNTNAHIRMCLDTL